MDKIILKDKTTFEILEGASLDTIRITTDNFDDIKIITDSFTKEGNLDNVTFATDDRITGEYTNLIYESFSYIVQSNTTTTTNTESDALKETSDATGEDTNKTYIVTVSLRESTALELKIKALEHGHTANAEAIETILTDIIPSIDEGVSE